MANRNSKKSQKEDITSSLLREIRRWGDISKKEDLRQLYHPLVTKTQKALSSWKSTSPPPLSGKTIQVLDFFCGCGGMSLGFSAVNRVLPIYRIIGGVDINQDALKTFSKNFSALGFKKDIRLLEKDQTALDEFLKKIDFDPTAPLVLIGCAPCQGFTSHRKKRWDNPDQRNDLVSTFCRLAIRLRPDAIIMENVPEMLSGKYREYFEQARNILTSADYVVRQQIFNLAAFGVPQERFRSLIMAMPKNFLLPTPIIQSADYNTVRHAIGHLPAVKPGEYCPSDLLHRSAHHRSNTLKTIRAVPKNGGSRPRGVGPACLDRIKGFADVYGRLAWDKPAITITHYARNPASGRYVHPEQDRGLTTREAALLQSFPLGFEFLGSFDPIFKQIGEAVPPSFSCAVAVNTALEILATPPTEQELEQSSPSIEKPVSSSFSSVIAGLKIKGRANGIYVH